MFCCSLYNDFLFYFHNSLIVEFFNLCNSITILGLFCFFLSLFMTYLCFFLQLTIWYFLSHFIIFLLFNLHLDTPYFCCHYIFYPFLNMWYPDVFPIFFAESFLLFLFIFSVVYVIFSYHSGFLLWFSTSFSFSCVSISVIFISCDCCVCMCFHFGRLLW